tara:strand:+ start:864 stop:1475 length:612 start_codon:yes stop_codon:yes gene_type:complete
MFLENREELANSNKLKDNTSLQYQKKIEEACVELLNPHGKVLQFGYSYGYASKLITSFRIDELIIIEPIKEVFQKAKEWSKNNKSTKVLNSSIEDVLSSLSELNSIYLDCFNVNSSDGKTDLQNIINTRRISLIVESLLNTSVNNARFVVLFDASQSLNINSMYLPYLKVTYHDVGKLLSLEHDDESLYKIVVIEKNSNNEEI